MTDVQTMAPAAGDKAKAKRVQRMVEDVVRVGPAGSRTLYVELHRFYKHPKYGKSLQRTKVLAVDVPAFESVKPGDVVEIVSCRPISGSKRFRMVKVVKRAEVSPAKLD